MYLRNDLNVYKWDRFKLMERGKKSYLDDHVRLHRDKLNP